MGAVVERGKTQGGGTHIEISYGGRDCPFMGIDSTALDPILGRGNLHELVLMLLSFLIH